MPKQTTHENTKDRMNEKAIRRERAKNTPVGPKKTKGKASSSASPERTRPT